MKKILIPAIFLLIMISITGCGFSGASIKKDRALWLEGMVYDEEGQPLQGVEVAWADVLLKTGESGCFFLGGDYPDGPLEIAFYHRKYKEVETSREFGNYRMAVYLPKLESPSEARFDWAPEENTRRPGCDLD